MSIGRLDSVNKVDRENASSSGGLSMIDKAGASTAAPRNEKVDTVAKMYEKQFLREMVKAMRSTIDDSADKPSMGEGIYRQQLDEEYTESWGEHGGVGLADLIYNQIMDRYFNNGAGQQLKGTDKSIPLTDRDVSKVIRVKTAEGPSQVPLRIMLKPSTDGSPAKVRAPWAGEVVSNSQLEGGKTALTLKHETGLKSTLIFQGVAAAGAKPGARFDKGDAVGTLSPEIHSFFWNINKAAANLDGGRGQEPQQPL